MNFFNVFKRKREGSTLSKITEVKIYAVDCEETAEQFFRIQLENEALKQQLKQCENNFQLRVELEVNLQISELAKENHHLRREIHELKQQIETLN